MTAAPPVPPGKPDWGLRRQPCAFLASDPCFGPYIPSHWMAPHGLACQVAGQTCLREPLLLGHSAAARCTIAEHVWHGTYAFRTGALLPLLAHGALLTTPFFVHLHLTFPICSKRPGPRRPQGWVAAGAQTLPRPAAQPRMELAVALAPPPRPSPPALLVPCCCPPPAPTDPLPRLQALSE